MIYSSNLGIMNAMVLLQLDNSLNNQKETKKQAVVPKQPILGQFWSSTSG